MQTDTSRFHQAFFDEVGEHLDTLERLLLAISAAEADSEKFDALFRAVHSIKGGSGMFGFPDMAAFAHVVEFALDALRTHAVAPSETLIEALFAARDVLALQLSAHRIGATAEPALAEEVECRLQTLLGSGASLPAASAVTLADDAGFGLFDENEVPQAEAVVPERRQTERRAPADATIRVDVGKIDRLINLVGEMVISHAKLSRSIESLDADVHDELHRTLREVEFNARDIQQSVMSVRMMQIGSIFGRFPRMVRELAARLGKEARLVTIGDETELDRNVIEQLVDPLTHLVRNCIDHGIEPTAQRLANEKTASGTIILRSSYIGGEVLIEVIDDGAGLDRERILATARERGIGFAPDLPDEDVWRMIFAAGFSTADAVTDVSGRGVGMDVVERNIRKLGGRIEIASTPGAGMRVGIRLPLTLAILDGLSVCVGSETFIIPLKNIIESVSADSGHVHQLARGRRVVSVRDEYFPVVVLSEVFHIEPRVADERGIFVLLEAGTGRVALYVDALEGQHQVVIKSLEANFRKVEGISAATIMGNGRVALILDAAALVCAA